MSLCTHIYANKAALRQVSGEYSQITWGHTVHRLGDRHLSPSHSLTQTSPALATAHKRPVTGPASSHLQWWVQLQYRNSSQSISLNTQGIWRLLAHPVHPHPILSKKFFLLPCPCPPMLSCSQASFVQSLWTLPDEWATCSPLPVTVPPNTVSSNPCPPVLEKSPVLRSSFSISPFRAAH